MSNRFHTKFHRQNHHTYPNPYNADAGHDPIASKEQPFKGDFVLAGTLSSFAPTSAVAGFFYSNNTALCAIAGNTGIYLYSNQNSNNTGIYVYSSGIALSAQSNNIGINVYSLQNGIDVYGNLNAIRSYSPNFGISSFGGNYGGYYSSSVTALSCYGRIYGAQITSPTYGLNVWGGTDYAGNFYSNNRGLSSFGGQIGIDVYSPIRGINVRALSAAVVAFSPTVSLSSGGGGVNVFNNKTGIFKTPALSSSISLDVKGDTYVDGNLTITGDISAYGIFNSNIADTRYGVLSCFYKTSTSTLNITDVNTWFDPNIKIYLPTGKYLITAQIVYNVNDTFGIKNRYSFDGTATWAASEIQNGILSTTPTVCAFNVLPAINASLITSVGAVTYINTLNGCIDVTSGGWLEYKVNAHSTPTAFAYNALANSYIKAEKI
jgi:hypothetical protein